MNCSCLDLLQMSADIIKLKEEVSKRDQQLLLWEEKWVGRPCITRLGIYCCGRTTHSSSSIHS